MDKENGRCRAEDQESHWERDKDRHHRAKDILNNHVYPNKEEYCTPSYRLLPKNVRNRRCGDIFEVTVKSILLMVETRI